MNKEQKARLYELKKSVAKLFQYRCYVCYEHSTQKNQMVFHHKWYEQGDRTYDDFKKNGYPDTLAYHEYLIPIIKKNPKRFLMLCSRHHVILERMKRWNSDKLRRLVNAVKMSKNIP